MTRIFLRGGYYIDTHEVTAHEVAEWINTRTAHTFTDLHGNEATVNADDITSAITNKEIAA